MMRDMEIYGNYCRGDTGTGCNATNVDTEFVTSVYNSRKKFAKFTVYNFIKICTNWFWHITGNCIIFEVSLNYS